MDLIIDLSQINHDKEDELFIGAWRINNVNLWTAFARGFVRVERGFYNQTLG